MEETTTRSPRSRSSSKGDVFKVETDDARRDRAELSMTATFHIANLLQAEQKYQNAIDAYKGYLAQFPNGPNSADAQRAILDTRLAIAADLNRQEKYEQARVAWREFAAENPLDGRVPEALYLIGASYLLEKKQADAEKAWEALSSKFPNSEPAGHAEFQVAFLLENDKGDLEGAIERYRKIKVEPWRSQALQRVAVMKAKSLVVVTPRMFRNGETPKLKIASRNIEKLTFTAYKLDLEAYFRKKQTLTGVEALEHRPRRPTPNGLSTCRNTPNTSRSKPNTTSRSRSRARSSSKSPTSALSKRPPSSSAATSTRSSRLRAINFLFTPKI